MAIDADSFKQGMRQLAATVTIVTTEHDGERCGLTATAVCSLSADPPTLLVCVNREAGTHDRIRFSRRFCVNVLSDEDTALSRRFAGPEKGEARFAIGVWRTGVTGAPILDHALASFDCELIEHVEAGTHTIFIGRVIAVETNPGRRPLLYADGDYSGLAALEDIMAGRA
jgi:flavin reductase (DIM6/NTAB) family NADH-FMN oxidoreductase RutF